MGEDADYYADPVYYPRSPQLRPIKPDLYPDEPSDKWAQHGQYELFDDHPEEGLWGFGDIPTEESDDDGEMKPGPMYSSLSPAASDTENSHVKHGELETSSVKENPLEQDDISSAAVRVLKIVAEGTDSRSKQTTSDATVIKSEPTETRRPFLFTGPRIGDLPPIRHNSRHSALSNRNGGPITLPSVSDQLGDISHIPEPLVNSQSPPGRPPPHYCSVKGCPRSEGGKGFKRKNEIIRHGLVHDSPGYVCPFCPNREHKYPRPDNLQR